MFLNPQSKPKFSYKDISLVPTKLSPFSSRNQIEIDYNPIISAPMDSVISIDDNSFNKEYIQELTNLGIKVCLPRKKDYKFDDINNFCRRTSYFHNVIHSISLDNFRELIKDYIYYQNFFCFNSGITILVDIANGHIQELYDLSKQFLEYFPITQLMIGNIANPETYEVFAKLGVHYLRLGIGGGSVCITSSNTKIHYPMASLINDCYEIKKKNNFSSLIVADGGFKNYDDIIAALALGADYIMLGSILNKTISSDSYPYLWKKIKIKNKKFANFLFKHKFKLYKKHIGMSTKHIQKKWNGDNLKTSEGIIRWNSVDYTLDGWYDNFISYLKSNMSYLGCNKLSELKEKAKFIFITKSAYESFNR